MAQFIPMIMAVVGTGAKVAAARQESKSEQQRYEAAATAERYNAAVKRQKAESVTAAYGAKEVAQRRAAALAAGKRSAAMGQSGIGMSSFDDTERQSQMFAELDALNIRYEGALENKGLLDSASLSDYNSSVNLQSRDNAKKAGRINTAAAIISGGSQAYGAYPK